MLILRKGSKVPFPEKLQEGYQINNDYMITANVNAEKISDVVEHFICIHDEPLFFILELPSEKDKEKEISPGILNKLHKDIYYIDGCSKEESLTIMLRIGELLINDGLCAFGFGGHNSNDEIMVNKYNIVAICSQDIAKYKSFFEKHNIEQVSELITAWDTFTAEHPGESIAYSTEGKKVYDVIDMFKDWGIYLAETREE